MQSAIDNLIYAPATTALESQPASASAHTTGEAITINKGQAGE